MSHPKFYIHLSCVPDPVEAEEEVEEVEGEMGIVDKDWCFRSGYSHIDHGNRNHNLLGDFYSKLNQTQNLP